MKIPSLRDLIYTKNLFWYRFFFGINFVYCLSIGVNTVQAQILRDSLHFVPREAFVSRALNEVRDIYQDPDGIFWISSHRGLNKFDGTSFQKLEIKDSEGHILRNLEVDEIVKSKVFSQAFISMYSQRRIDRI